MAFIRTRTRRHLLLACVLGLAPGGASLAGEAVEPVLAPGEHEIHLELSGQERFYLVQVPSQVASGQALPVVLNFHGGGGTPTGHRDSSAMADLAETEGFLLVHPAGTPARFVGRRLMTWNAGHCCGRAAKEDVDDIGFVRALLDDLATRAPVDPERVYATGHSNGGMMAMRVGAELADRIAAIAPVGGAARMDRFPPARPMPVLHIHSVDDPRALYEGGLGPPFPLTRHRVDHVAVETSLLAWREVAGCPDEPTRGETRRKEMDDGSEHTATEIRFGPCAEGSEVILLQLTGAGHGWPGSGVERPRLIGPRTDVVDAGREAWAFFRRHRLPSRAAAARAAD